MAERVDTINHAYKKVLGVNRSQYILLKYIFQTTGSDGWSHARLKTIAKDHGWSVEAKFVSKLIKILSHEQRVYKKIIPPLLERTEQGIRLLFKWNEQAYIFEQGGYTTVMVGAKHESGLTHLQHNLLRFIENYAYKQGLYCNYHNEGTSVLWTDIPGTYIAKTMNIYPQNVSRILKRLKDLGRIDIGTIADPNNGSVLYEKAIIILKGVLDIEKDYELPKSMFNKRGRFTRNGIAYYARTGIRTQFSTPCDSL